MKIGDRVVIQEDIEMWKKTFKKGHQFTIIDSDDFRGFTIRDDDGNTIAETRFVKMVNLQELRETKINQILGGDE